MARVESMRLQHSGYVEGRRRSLRSGEKFRTPQGTGILKLFCHWTGLRPVNNYGRWMASGMVPHGGSVATSSERRDHGGGWRRRVKKRMKMTPPRAKN